MSNTTSTKSTQNHVINITNTADYIKGTVPSSVFICLTYTVIGKNLTTKRSDFIHMCPLRLMK